MVARSLGRLAGKAILERHPHLQQVHGYQANDFGAIVAQQPLATILGIHPLGIVGRKPLVITLAQVRGKPIKIN